MIFRTFLFSLAGLALVFFVAIIFGFVSFKAATTETNLSIEQKIVEPLGLPPVPWPRDNPYSKEKAELGHLLYFDKRLSSDGSIACASCHNLPCAFGDCKPLAVGISDHEGTRHSPTIINAAYASSYFWDGRASSLEEQCKGPLGNTKEMTLIADVHAAHRQCVEQIRSIPGYQVLFKNVFGNIEISINEIAQAIATFERTVLSGNSPYDQYRAGNRAALSEEQISGFMVFKKVGCINCHGGFNFSDDRFLNIGIGMDAAEPDLGRYAITHEPKDWGAFKVPTLREVDHTAPYMHDGSLTTLEAVVDYYDKGGIPNKNLHPLLRPLHLSPQDKKALISFLKALNGEGWQNFKAPEAFPE